MDKPVELENIKNIAVSGRIASGATTLAKSISEILGWNFLEIGKLDEIFYKQLSKNEVDVSLRPDRIDIEREEMVKRMFREEQHNVIQSHLAGFNAQNIPGVFKVLTICENEKGEDQTQIRIDRLVNRKGISVTEAKNEVNMREKGLLEKWSRLYVNSDTAWYYWDKKYFDLVINTYFYNKEESVEMVLKAINYSWAQRDKQIKGIKGL